MRFSLRKVLLDPEGDFPHVLLHKSKLFSKPASKGRPNEALWFAPLVTVGGLGLCVPPNPTELPHNPHPNLTFPKAALHPGHLEESCILDTLKNLALLQPQSTHLYPHRIVQTRASRRGLPRPLLRSATSLIFK